MKRIVKLVGFVLLGFAIAALLFGLLTFGVLGAIRPRSGGSEAFLIFLIMMPVALFLGSSLTGYLSHPYLRTRFSRIGVTPGLYLFFIRFRTEPQNDSHNACPIIKSLEQDPKHVPSAFGFAFIIGWGLLWFLSSWAGVELGCYVRSRRNQNRTSSSSGRAGTRAV
jgi:hypothetical protein